MKATFVAAVVVDVVVVVAAAAAATPLFLPRRTARVSLSPPLPRLSSLRLSSPVDSCSSDFDLFFLSDG